MNHKDLFLLVYLLLIIPLSLEAQNRNKKRISVQDYINKYRSIALAEMKRSGIPASVTLAQGILESANGNSMLARKGNNHFGIKCHKAWRGKKVFAFDDGRSSCFRKYRSDYTSYIDHSNFLHNNPRYGSLFNLSETDYEAWCKGLKKAGYATNPKYAKRLIAIIKMYNLHEFDVQTDPGFCKEAVFAVPSTYNGIKTVIFNCRVTPYLVARAYKITESKIIEYNNLYINDTIPANTMVFLQSPKRRGPLGISAHKVSGSESMEDIANLYGIQLSKLYKNNSLPKGLQPQKGEMVSLRKKMKEMPKTLAHSTIIYKVKSGDTLSEIAYQYGVSVSSIKLVNNLKSDKIIVGQKLQIKVIGSQA